MSQWSQLSGMCDVFAMQWLGTTVGVGFCAGMMWTCYGAWIPLGSERITHIATKKQMALISFMFHITCGTNQTRRGSTTPVEAPAPPRGSHCCPRMWSCGIFALWPLSRLLSGRCWRLHMRSNPFMTYHPTCKGTALWAVTQHLDLYRIWQITVSYRRNRLSKVTSKQPRQSPEPGRPLLS